MKTILFTPVAFNLSETSMAIEMAKVIAGDFQCHFASYGGEFENLIEKEGFPLTRLEPRFTPQTIARIYALDQGRSVRSLHTVDVVREMVHGELELYKLLHPAAVVTGMNPTPCISCPTAQIPLIWIIQSGKVLNASARAGGLKNMDMLDIAPIRWLPDAVRVKLSKLLMSISFASISRSYNQVAVEYGQEPFHNFDEVLWRSSYQLVVEPPEFSNLHFPPTAHFIGPLIARLDVPLPGEVINLPRDLPIIYFAMGSSGRPEIAAHIIAGFAGKPYRVIAPVKYMLDKRPVEIPDNVLVTDWLPALEANRLADLAVTHGGHGTVMNACLAGKPVVGVAMSPEQFLNLECLVAKGFAIRIPRNNLSIKCLCDSIDRLLGDPVAQAKAQEYRKVVEEWDNPERIRRFFCETLR